MATKIRTAMSIFAIDIEGMAGCPSGMTGTNQCLIMVNSRDKLNTFFRYSLKFPASNILLGEARHGGLNTFSSGLHAERTLSIG